MRFRLLESDDGVMGNESDSSLPQDDNSQDDMDNPVKKGPNNDGSNDIEKILYNRYAKKADRHDALIKYLDQKGMKPISDLLKSPGNSSAQIESALLYAFDKGKRVVQQVEPVLKSIRVRGIRPEGFGNLARLVTLIDGGTITVTPKSTYLHDPSLYNRNIYDFEYAVRVFDALTDPSKTRKFFGDKKVSSEMLYDGNVIKPSGAATRDKTDKTIHGTIQRLTDESTGSGGKQPSSDSRYTTYKSLDGIDKSENKEGNIVHINGDYKFVKGNWVPLKT